MPAGCCGVAVGVRRSGWEPNPFGGFLVGGLPGWGRLEAAPPAEPGAAPCCDACAGKDLEPIDGCSTGACGLPMTAGIPLPLGHGAGAVRATYGAVPRGVDDYAAAWAKATGIRSAGVVMNLGAVNFQPSTLAELRALGTVGLAQRSSRLRDLEDSRPLTAAEEIESGLVEQALLVADDELTGMSDAAICAEVRTATGARRTALQAEGHSRLLDCSGTSDAPEPDAARRREIAEAAADRLEPGDTPAERARHDAIVRQAVTGTLATFNRWLDGEYGVQVEQIRGSTSITLARLRNENDESRRTYDLLRNQNLGGGGSSGGGGGAAVGLTLLGLLALMAKGF